MVFQTYQYQYVQQPLQQLHLEKPLSSQRDTDYKQQLWNTEEFSDREKVETSTIYTSVTANIKTLKRNAKKAKWLSEEALQIAVKRIEARDKAEKERYTHLNA